MKRNYTKIDWEVHSMLGTNKSQYFSVNHLAKTHNRSGTDILESVRRLIVDGYAEVKFRDKHIYARLIKR